MVRRYRPSYRASILAPAALLIVIFLTWWATTSFSGIEAWRLPSPSGTWARFLTMASSASLWSKVAVTAAEALSGSLLGLLLALPLAYLIYRLPLVSAAVEPFLGATQALPAIALAPVLVLWIGYGPASITVLCALIVFFPILVSTCVGLRHLNSEILEAAELDGASGLMMVFGIEFPLAAPSILGGIRNGFTLSVTGAVVGEMVMGGSGLGQALTQARAAVDTAGMFVIITILCLLATLVYVAIYRIERSHKYALA